VNDQRQSRILKETIESDDEAIKSI
jgi:hypothetical protein